MRLLIVCVAACCLASACAAPFGLGEPSSRSLERGVVDSLDATSSFEVTGYYTEGGVRWSIDQEQTRAGAFHVLLSGGSTVQLKAVMVDGRLYFRGRRFLADHLGGDAASQALAAAAGSAWWQSAVASVPRLPDLFDGASFRTTFLGSAASRRTDHVAIDGVDAVELSGQRGDVYVAEAAPNRLVHLHMQPGVVIDGVGEADLRFENYDRDFRIAAPTDVIDFSNLSTLPPVYTVLSVDTGQCASPCLVSAQLKNLGGPRGASAPSTVTFTMTDTAGGGVLGRCSVDVVPDVGYNATTTAACTILGTVPGQTSATVTAVAFNPGRA